MSTAKKAILMNITEGNSSNASSNYCLYPVPAYANHIISTLYDLKLICIDPLTHVLFERLKDNWAVFDIYNSAVIV